MKVVVEFEGDGSGSGELSWGQQDIWNTIRRVGSWLPLGGVTRVPVGTTVEDVADQVRYIMGRYQSLRTRVRFAGEQRPGQVVSGRGAVGLEVVDADGGDPDQVAVGLRQRYQATGLDFADEWPIRVGVVRQDGRPTHLVVLISHLAADAHGAQVLLREVTARPAAPVDGLQPLDQARWQRSAAGQRQNDAALRYHESILRAVAPGRFAGSRETGRPAVWDGEFRSPAMHTAVTAIAGGAGVDSPTLLLAVFAVALARVTGVNPVVVRPLVGNRFRPGLADVFCTVTQPGLCALDVADTPFGEVLARVKRAATTAYKHAYYDPLDLDALLDRVSRERRADIDIACFFNHRRGAGRAPATGRVTAQDLREALPRSVLQWTATERKPMARTFFRVEDDVDDAMRMSVLIDTNVLSLADAEACLRGMEAVALEVAGEVLIR